MRFSLTPYLIRRIPCMNADATARPFSVLVVDDDRAAADALTTLLRQGGYDARAAYDAERAMAMYRQWPADAAVLDIVMEDINGIDLARKLRLMSTRPLLLVALTGLGTPDEIAPLQVSEFNHFLLKPVNTDELLGLLDARACRRPAV
jgi:CheY-like chemotaxis protein